MLQRYVRRSCSRFTIPFSQQVLQVPCFFNVSIDEDVDRALPIAYQNRRSRLEPIEKWRGQLHVLVGGSTPTVFGLA